MSTDDPSVAPIDPEVIDVGAETLPAPVRSLIEGQKGFDLKTAMEELEYRTVALKQLRSLCLSELKPRDFIFHGSGDDARAYLQDTGAQRLHAILGPTYPTGVKPAAKRMDLGNGEFACIIEGWVGSRYTQSVAYVVGGRSSTEKFFDRFLDDGTRCPVDYLDVLKAAYTNWENRAFSGLAGLRGLTKADLREMSFNVDRSQSISHGEGKKGGGGKGGSNTIPKFGRDHEALWGKPWTEATPAALKFYKAILKKNVEDPEKAKWKAANERTLEAIHAEIHRRQEVVKAEGDGDE
jgi:hypothetical protein